MTTCRQGLWAPPLGRSRLLVSPDRLATYLWVLTDVFDRSARSSEAARGNDQMPIGTSHSCYAISPRSCKKGAASGFGHRARLAAPVGVAASSDRPTTATTCLRPSKSSLEL